jgi:EAL and modified HD-GYP domain-containing signal transduction protein
MPMDGVLAPMHIAPEVRSALLSRSGPYAAALALVEAQEHGDWCAVDDAAAAVGIAPAAVSAAYAEALAWAAERLAGD